MFLKIKQRDDEHSNNKSWSKREMSKINIGILGENK